jgi:parallel beta-helix repeat protein
VGISPGASIQAKIDAHPAGTTFCINEGVHRLAAPLLPKSGDRFIGQGRAVLSGARVLSSFTRSGSYWLATGQTQESAPVGVCIEGYTGCQYNEDVYMDNVSLWQVTSLSQLGPGKFYFDYGADTIYLADDPTGRPVEATIARKSFWGGPSGVQIKGLTIEKFSNPAQDTCVGGWHSGLFAGNEIRFCHGTGVGAYSYEIIKNNWIHDMGQMGVSAPGTTGAVFEDNEISYNNTMGFRTGWEAGGSKFSGTTGLTLRRNYFHDNMGSGPWLDGNNYQYLIEDNRIERNAYDGIVVEISYGGTIRGNLILNNGHCGSCWGAGMLIAESSGVEFYGNTLTGNKEAVLLIMRVRSEMGRFGTYDLKGNRIYQNAISLHTGQIGMKQYVGDDSYFCCKGNSLDYNRYTAGIRPAPFAWSNGFMTFIQLQAAGHETHGIWTP